MIKLTALMIISISIAISIFTNGKHAIVVKILKDRNTELLSRLALTTSLCSTKYKTISQYKQKIEYLNRSLNAVKRDMWSEESLAKFKKDNKFYGKGEKKLLYNRNVIDIMEPQRETIKKIFGLKVKVKEFIPNNIIAICDDDLNVLCL